jgi:hypothetical protein
VGILSTGNSRPRIVSASSAAKAISTRLNHIQKSRQLLRGIRART